MGRISLFSLHRQVRQAKRRILFSLVCSRGSGADLFKNKSAMQRFYNRITLSIFIITSMLLSSLLADDFIATHGTSSIKQLAVADKETLFGPQQQSR